MSVEWYITQNGQQVGPVSPEQLQQMVGAGQVAATELVWCEGMPNWVTVAEVPGLTTAGSGAPASQAGGSTIGYYNPTAGLGSRVANTLRGYPTPTGPQHEWPLSPTQLAQLRETETHRKNIRTLSSLFNALFALTLIGVVVLFLVAIVGLAATRGGGIEVGVLMIVVLVLGALSSLYFFAARATKQCRTWPAITFIVLFSLSVLLNVASCLLGMSSSRGPAPEAMISAVLGSVLPVLFLVTCVRGLTSIPRFLASPVWCQEALVNAKL